MSRSQLLPDLVSCAAAKQHTPVWCKNQTWVCAKIEWLLPKKWRGCCCFFLEPKQEMAQADQKLIHSQMSWLLNPDLQQVASLFLFLLSKKHRVGMVLFLFAAEGTDPSEGFSLEPGGFRQRSRGTLDDPRGTSDLRGKLQDRSISFWSGLGACVVFFLHPPALYLRWIRDRLGPCL